MSKSMDNILLLAYYLNMIRKVEIGIAGRALRSDSFAWIERLATHFRIRGAVFTRPDGSVRVSAEGEEQTLHEFARRIEESRIFGTVENFFVEWREPSRNSNFQVLVGC